MAGSGSGEKVGERALLVVLAVLDVGADGSCAPAEESLPKSCGTPPVSSDCGCCCCCCVAGGGAAFLSVSTTATAGGETTAAAGKGTIGATVAVVLAVVVAVVGEGEGE